MSRSSPLCRVCLFATVLGIAVVAPSQAQRADDSWIRLTNTGGGLFGINGGLATVADIDDNGVVYAIIRENVGRDFVARIARWDGANWSIRGGYVNLPRPDQVFDVCVNPAGTALVVAGSFAGGGDATGAVALANVGRFDLVADSWDRTFVGLDNTVRACGEDAGGNFFALGLFTADANGTALPQLGRWDAGTRTWGAIGNGTGQLAQGIFVEPDGSVLLARNPVERYDVSTGLWSTLGTPFDAASSVRNVMDGGGAVIVGGSLTRSGVKDQVWRWDGVQWDRIDGLPGTFFPRDLRIDGNGTLYAIPEISDGRVYNRPAAANAWSEIASSNFEILQRLATNPRRAADDVHLIGVFKGLTDSSGVVVPAVKQARWDGAGWQALLPQGSGTTGVINFLSQVGRRRGGSGRYLHGIVAGGEVSKLNHVSVNRVGYFDGTRWDKMGLGISDPLGVARAADGLEQRGRGQYWIYVGGRFTEVMNADGTPVAAGNIAVWDTGSKTWAPVGRGVGNGGVPGTGIVNAVATWSVPGISGETYLYVGGEFDSALNADGTSVAAANIARYNFNTDSWEPVEGGVDGTVHSLAVSQWFHSEVVGSSLSHTLFVGGDFNNARDAAGNAVANTANVVRLTSRDEWSPVGKGANGPVLAMQYVSSSYGFEPALHGILYIGGDFSNVTDAVGPVRPAANLAKWYSLYDQWDVFGPAPLENGVNSVVRTLDFLESASGPVPDATQTLIVGGDFTSAWNRSGQISVNRVAFLKDDVPLADYFGGRPSWARETFQPLGGGLDDAVRAAVSTSCTADNDVFFGGDFQVAGLNPPKSSPHLVKWRAGQVPRITEWSVIGGSGGCRGRCQASVQVLAPRCNGGFLSKSGTASAPPVGFGETAGLESNVSIPEVPVRFTLTDSSGVRHVADSVVVHFEGRAALIISGVNNPAQFAANPDGKPTQLTVTPVQVPTAGTSANPLVRFFNAVTDAPTIDVVMATGEVLADSIAYGDLAVPVQLAAGSYTAEVRRNDDGSLVATLPFVAGANSNGQVVIVAGFVEPAANQNGQPLTLLSVDAGVPTDVVDVEDELPTLLDVGAPYPNPTHDIARLHVNTSESRHLNVAVFDVLGRRVATLYDGLSDRGQMHLSWNAVHSASGVYFVRAQQGAQVQVRPVTVIR